MNPTTVIELAENAYMEMDTAQIKGVDDTIRNTKATLQAGATLKVGEKLMTHGNQYAETRFEVDLNGENSGVHVVSRSVAKENSKQLFVSHVNGNSACSGHTECDAIIMDNASVSAVPEIMANHTDAQLIHEAAIGKIAGEQLIKLMTLGLTEKEAEEQIRKNTEMLKGETIIASCAGCYKTLSDDYEGLDVIHISQLLNKLIKEGRIKLSKMDLDVTYHDSCHLGRHSEVFDDPREVIESVANLVEMENIRENSLCCGAGGGVKSAYPEIAEQLAKARIEQAKDTGCQTLITACPFCKLNLKNDDMEVLDLTEFLVEYGDVDES
jgi:hypothetical protein